VLAELGARGDEERGGPRHAAEPVAALAVLKSARGDGQRVHRGRAQGLAQRAEESKREKENREKQVAYKHTRGKHKP